LTVTPSVTATGQTQPYWLCGWRLISEPELPELNHRDDGLAPEISIRFAEVPEILEDPVVRTPFCSVSKDGRALITIAAVGRFLIRNGTEILVQPAQSAQPSAIRLFLWDMAFGILCRQRGFFPLHASCVEFDGEAVALAGHSAMGKSTLAFSLAARGHRVLADNVTVIDASAPHGPAVVPAPSFLNLWRDSLNNAEAGVAFPHDHPECMRPEMGKYQIRIREAPPARPALPLRAVLTLEFDTMAHQPRRETLRGLEAVRLLTSQMSLRRAMVALWENDILFQHSSRIAANACIERLISRAAFPELETLTSFVETSVTRCPLPA